MEKRSSTELYKQTVGGQRAERGKGAGELKGDGRAEKQFPAGPRNTIRKNDRRFWREVV